MNSLNRVGGKLKKLFERIHNERFKQNLLQAIPFWIASLLTGLVAVFYARLFALAESGTAYIMHHYRVALFVVTPLCFLIGWAMVKYFAPFARGSGIPQVMASIELATPRQHDKVDRLLSIKIIVIKILSSLSVVFGGGVIGREGPTIQIAASIFRTVNVMLPKWWPKVSKRNMIMTGAASGLAAAFNTPLGGIVFAVEELTKTHINYFKTALFTAIIIAGLTAQGLLGPYLYLGYPAVSGSSFMIFLWIIVIAIFAGLLGSSMSKIMLYVLEWISKFKLKRSNVIYLLCCGLIIAATGYFVDGQSIGSGKELMTTSLFTDAKYVPWYLPFFRIEGLIVSFTTGVAGGVFAPSLSAGASVGSVMAGWLHLAPADTNLLILSGMVAFLTGVTRTPFTSAILVLEMTDRHNVIFHLMLAGMAASLVSLLIDKHSFYDHLKIQYLREISKGDVATDAAIIKDEPENEEPEHPDPSKY